MSMRIDVLWLIMIFSLASLFCRISGFWLMRWVRFTPRLEASLKATPLAVMVGIVAPTAVSGRPVELLALVVIVAVMRFKENDLLAAMAGMAIIAVGRWLQLAA